MPNSWETKIKEIYADYQENVKPLIYYIERKFHRFPLSLLNEIRDVFDHISRCYEPYANQKYIDKNIEKAQNHFTRIKLDAYKYVNDVKRKDFVKWKKKYNKYDLQNINDGDFWKHILDLEDEAERLFAEAKKQETKDVNESYDLFYLSADKYEQIDNLIDEKRQFIVKAKFKYRQMTFFNHLTGFIIGIISSIIASVLHTDVREIIQELFQKIIK